MYTLVAVSGLLSPSAFVRLPEMRISVLHKGHSILFHLLDFISVFAPQKPVFAAVRLHFACGETALAFLAPAEGMIPSHPKDAGKFEIRFFDRATRMSFLLLSVATKNQSSFAVGGPGASERGVKKNHDLIRNLKS